jgi:hypothetical protein
MVSTLFCRKLNSNGLVFNMMHLKIPRSASSNRREIVDMNLRDDGRDGDVQIVSRCHYQQSCPILVENSECARR